MTSLESFRQSFAFSGDEKEGSPSNASPRLNLDGVVDFDYPPPPPRTNFNNNNINNNYNDISASRSRSISPAARANPTETSPLLTPALAPSMSTDEHSSVYNSRNSLNNNAKLPSSNRSLPLILTTALTSPFQNMTPVAINRAVTEPNHGN